MLGCMLFASFDPTIVSEAVFLISDTNWQLAKKVYFFWEPAAVSGWNWYDFSKGGLLFSAGSSPSTIEKGAEMWHKLKPERL